MIVWTCPKCKRIFQKVKQPHSCHLIPLTDHFKNKKLAKELFDIVVKKINVQVGKCKIISLPCCVHLFGNNDFLAFLPKKDGLELHFGLMRKLVNPRIKEVAHTSKSGYSHALEIKTVAEIDRELLSWLSESYHLKDKK